ncbi:unnamed protein product [Amoebophrya sp. A120]|nr:unnamed protein product [Amoebophrya sp. A120]|eukprot:GSA120T00025941001.1
MRVLDLKVTKSIATVSRQKELCRSIVLWQQSRSRRKKKHGSSR